MIMITSWKRVSDYFWARFPFLYFDCFHYSSVRLVILGEATTLSTFFLKNNQLTKANYDQLSRLSSFILEDEDETELNEDNLVVDPLIKSLILLKSRLSKDQIVSLEPIFIKPFCDVIINKDVSGPITGLALQSILKFLNYGFIKDGEIVRLIGESVTKARFVGTDSSSDEVVLMRILSVLENLIVQPFYSLTNGLVCEIMQSCFRIAFETRLSELLRKCAIKSLTEMSRALFSRISYFDQDISDYNYFYQDKSNASFHKLNRMGRRFVNQNKLVFSNKQVSKSGGDPADSGNYTFLWFMFSKFTFFSSFNNILRCQSKELRFGVHSRTSLLSNIANQPIAGWSKQRQHDSSGSQSFDCHI